MQVEPLSSRRAVAHMDAASAEAAEEKEAQRPAADADADADAGVRGVGAAGLDADLAAHFDALMSQCGQQKDLDKAWELSVTRLPGSMQKEADTQALVEDGWGGICCAVVARAEADQLALLACREAAALLVPQLG